MQVYKKQHNIWIRVIAACLVCTFTLTSIPHIEEAHALAPWTATEIGNTKIESLVISLELAGRIKYATTNKDKNLLRRRDTKDLLLPTGEILLDEELKGDPVELLRAIIHEEVKSVMQILVWEQNEKHSNKLYQDIKELISPKESDSQVNHRVASAFELLILIKAGLVDRNELTPMERDFLKSIEPKIKSKEGTKCFTSIFWDWFPREMKIRFAIADYPDMKFYQVADEKDDSANQNIVDVQKLYTMLPTTPSDVTENSLLSGLLEREIAEGRKGATLLSVGCGDGSLEKELQDFWGLKVTGVDVTEKQVEITRSKGIDARLSDGEDLPFEDETFDIVLLSEVIGHMNPEKAFKEAFRVLKPGGIIHATTYPETLQLKPEFSSYTLYPVSDLIKEMKKAGFNNAAKTEFPSFSFSDFVYLRGSKPRDAFSTDLELIPVSDQNPFSSKSGSQSEMGDEGNKKSSSITHFYTSMLGVGFAQWLVESLFDRIRRYWTERKRATQSIKARKITLRIIRTFYDQDVEKQRNAIEKFRQTCEKQPSFITKELMRFIIDYLLEAGLAREVEGLLQEMLEIIAETKDSLITEEVLEKLMEIIENKNEYIIKRSMIVKILSLLMRFNKNFISEDILIRLLNLLNTGNSYDDIIIAPYILDAFNNACNINRDAITEKVLRRNVEIIRTLKKDIPQFALLNLRKAHVALAKAASLANRTFIDMYKSKLDNDMDGLLDKADSLMIKNRDKLEQLSPGAQQLAKVKFLLYLKGAISEQPDAILEEISAMEKPYYDFDNKHMIGTEIHIPCSLDDDEVFLLFGIFGYSDIVPGNLDEKNAPKIKTTFESPNSSISILEFQTLPSHSYMVQHEILKDIRKLTEMLGMKFIPRRNASIGLEKHTSISGELASDEIQFFSMVLNAVMVTRALKRYTGDEWQRLKKEFTPEEGHIEIRDPRDSALGGKRIEYLDVYYYLTSEEALQELFMNFNLADLRSKHLLSLALKKYYEAETLSDAEIASNYNEVCRKTRELIERKMQILEPKTNFIQEPHKLLIKLIENSEIAEELFVLCQDFLKFVESVVNYKASTFEIGGGSPMRADDPRFGYGERERIPASEDSSATLITPEKWNMYRGRAKYLAILNRVDVRHEFEKALKKAEVYVDAGCGIGRAAIEVAYHFSHLRAYGIDITPYDEELVRKNYHDWENFFKRKAEVGDRYEFIRADITNVSLPQKADLISSFFTLQYVEDPLKAFVNLYNQLNKDGSMFVVVAMPNDEQPYGYYRDLLHKLNESEMAFAPEPIFVDNIESSDARAYLIYVHKISDRILKTGMELVSSTEITIHGKGRSLVIKTPVYHDASGLTAAGSNPPQASQPPDSSAKYLRILLPILGVIYGACQSALGGVSSEQYTSDTGLSNWIIAAISITFTFAIIIKAIVRRASGLKLSSAYKIFLPALALINIDQTLKFAACYSGVNLDTPQMGNRLFGLIDWVRTGVFYHEAGIPEIIIRTTVFLAFIPALFLMNKRANSYLANFGKTILMATIGLFTSAGLTNLLTLWIDGRTVDYFAFKGLPLAFNLCDFALLISGAIIIYYAIKLFQDRDRDRFQATQSLHLAGVEKQPLEGAVAAGVQINPRINVLLLCSYNMERSPIVEQVMKAHIPPDLEGKINIASAAMGKLVSTNLWKDFLERSGLIFSHEPMEVTRPQLEEADIIFVMAKEQEKILKPFGNKTFLLLGNKDLNPDLEMDYPKTGRTYESFIRTIEDNLDTIFGHIRKCIPTPPASERMPQSESTPESPHYTGNRRIESFDRMKEYLRAQEKKFVIVVPQAQSKSALAAIDELINELGDKVGAVLVGDENRINEIISGLPHLRVTENKTVINAPDKTEAFRISMDIIRRGEAQILLKGDSASDELMAAVVSNANGIVNHSRFISHLRIFETPWGIMVMSDGGINVVSTRNGKRKEDLLDSIHDNAEQVARLSGDEKPKVFRLTSELSLREALRQKPDALIFPWIGPANIIYKACAKTPWRFKPASTRDIVVGGLGILSIFEKETGGFLIIATPKENASLTEKEKLLEKAVNAAKENGVIKPKVALLDFTERAEIFANKNVPSIVDEIEIVKHFEDSEECLVEGPMAYDLAVSSEAAKAKKFEGEVPGNPDILFMPDFDSGMMLRDLYNHWDEFGLPWNAGDISFGASVPVLIPSRSDSPEHKSRSIIAAAYLAAREAEKVKASLPSQRKWVDVTSGSDIQLWEFNQLKSLVLGILNKEFFDALKVVYGLLPGVLINLTIIRGGEEVSLVRSTKSTDFRLYLTTKPYKAEVRDAINEIKERIIFQAQGLRIAKPGETPPKGPLEPGSDFGRHYLKQPLEEDSTASDANGTSRNEPKKKRFNPSVKGTKRTGVSKWVLLAQFRQELRGLPEESIARLREATALGEKRKILIESGLDVAGNIDGKFLMQELDVFLQQGSLPAPTKVSSRRHILRYAGTGRKLIAYLGDDFDYIVKMAISSDKIDDVLRFWIGKGNALAKERLNGLAVPTMIIDATDGLKKPFSYILEKGGMKKADLAIVQKKVVPLIERMKYLVKEGKTSEAQDLVDKYKEFVISMFRRGVIDRDFTYPYNNCGVDLETGKILAFDFGDMVGSESDIGIFFENMGITNKYFYDDLKQQVSEKVAKYFAVFPLQVDDFFTESEECLFGVDINPKNIDKIRMTFPHSEEHIRNIFMNHKVRRIGGTDPAASSIEKRNPTKPGTFEIGGGSPMRADDPRFGYGDREIIPAPNPDLFPVEEETKPTPKPASSIVPAGDRPTLDARTVPEDKPTQPAGEDEIPPSGIMEIILEVNNITRSDTDIENVLQEIKAGKLIFNARIEGDSLLLGAIHPSEPHKHILEPSIMEGGVLAGDALEDETKIVMHVIEKPNYPEEEQIRKFRESFIRLARYLIEHGFPFSSRLIIATRQQANRCLGIAEFSKGPATLGELARQKLKAEDLTPDNRQNAGDGTREDGDKNRTVPRSVTYNYGEVLQDIDYLDGARLEDNLHTILKRTETEAVWRSQDVLKDATLFDRMASAAEGLYKKAHDKLPDFTMAANPSGEGMYGAYSESDIAGFLDHIGVAPDDSMLEVGSGDGSIADFIAHKFKIKVTGVEVWPPFYQYALILKNELLRRGFISEDMVRFVNKNFADEDFDFSKYSLIYYAALGTKRKSELAAKLLSVKKGCRILIRGSCDELVEGILASHPDFKVRKLEIEENGKLTGVQARVYTRVKLTSYDPTPPSVGSEKFFTGESPTMDLKPPKYRINIPAFFLSLEQSAEEVTKKTFYLEKPPAQVDGRLYIFSDPKEGRIEVKTDNQGRFVLPKEFRKIFTSGKVIITGSLSFERTHLILWDADVLESYWLEINRPLKAKMISEYYYHEGMMGRLTDAKATEQGSFGRSNNNMIVRTAECFLKGVRNPRVLDAGSGNAAAVSMFSLYADHVKGVEINEGLHKEGLKAIDELSEKGLIDKQKIELVHGDLFDEDFSKYDLIYIYWPFDASFDSDRERSEDFARRLGNKLSQELKPGAVCAIISLGKETPFHEFKELEQIDSPDFKESSPLVAYHAYRLPSERMIEEEHAVTPPSVVSGGEIDTLANFYTSIMALKEFSKQDFIDQIDMFNQEAGYYGKSGQSLILDADYILESVVMLDLEDTLNKLVKHKVLHGGKIVLFARSRENMVIVEQIIKRASSAIEVITITKDALRNTNGSELNEIKALVSFAKRKGAGNILALIRGPINRRIDQQELNDIARFCGQKENEIPLIVGGVEKGLYSFAQAITRAIIAKTRDGNKNWLIMLHPIEPLSKELQIKLEEYQHSLKTRVSA